MRREITYILWVELCLYTQHDRETNTAQPKKISYFSSRFVFHRFSPFNCCLNVVCSLTKGITPDVCRLCVCVLINKRSFEKEIVFGFRVCNLFLTLCCYFCLFLFLFLVFLFPKQKKRKEKNLNKCNEKNSVKWRDQHAN